MVREISLGKCFWMVITSRAPVPKQFEKSKMFEDIRQNVWQHSPERLATIPGMFGDIHWNV